MNKDALVEFVDPAPPDRAKPGSIIYEGGKLHQNADDAERALMDSSGVQIFQHAGQRLVRVGRSNVDNLRVQRQPGAPAIHEITSHWLVDHMTREISWLKHDKRVERLVQINAPLSVANTILARAGEWSFPVLRGFIEAPTLDLAAGRVITTPGYDAGTGLFLVGKALNLGRLGSLTNADARNAAGVLAEIFSTFPFTSPADEAGAIALVLTAIFRRLLPAAPLGAVTASTPGTGKSLFADCIAAVATGRRASAMAIGADNTETEKRIDAALLDGDAIVLIDNIERPVKSDILCQVSTQTSKTVRVLGQSRKVEAPTNVLFLLTGNNLTLIGDIIRRVLVVRLDAGVERPELRRFERDAVGHILRHRVAVVRAAIVLAKAYMAAGSPDLGLPPYGSFELWDRVVRRPIVWAGFPDPLDAAADLRSEDHELVAMRELLAAWWDQYQDAPKTAGEVIGDARAQESRFDGRGDRANPELMDALASVLGDIGKVNAQALGYKLRTWQNRILGGFIVKRDPNGSKRNGINWILSKA